MAETTKRISFASFKGGAGRSVALANVAYHLARRGKRVGCVDFDIEAGGLHLIFNIKKPADKNGVEKQGVQHFLMGKTNYKKKYSVEPPDYESAPEFIDKLVCDVLTDSFEKKFRSAQIPGAIYLVHSQVDPDVTAYVDLQNLFAYSDRVLDFFGEHLSLDYILIDCRAGVSRIAFPGLAYTDAMVVCMRWGRQHQMGTAALVDWYGNWSAGMNNYPGVILAATSMTGSRPQERVETFCELLRTAPNAIEVIPHIDQLVEEDGVLFGDDDDSCYAKLAQTIETLVSNDDE